MKLLSKYPFGIEPYSFRNTTRFDKIVRVEFWFKADLDFARKMSILISLEDFILLNSPLRKLSVYTGRIYNT